MKNERRLTVAASSGYTARTEVYNGREHLVVPVVALVEGVIHALSNKASGPEFVPASVYQKNIERWEGKPIYEGHPLLNGRPVRGDNATMRAGKSIGEVRNAAIVNEQLGMEAWLDVAVSKLKAPELLARARAGEPIEISVGVLVDAIVANGEYNGRGYGGQWSEIEPDHLALLPEGVLGACSRTMGCGVRAAEDASLLSDDDMSDEYRFAYSPDQERNEKGQFGAAAASHEKAAKAHEKAATANDKADKASSKDSMKSVSLAGEHASQASEHAHNATKEADKTGHGHKGAMKSSDESKKANSHKEAANHHREAAGHHSSAAADLLKKLAEADKNLRGAEMDKPDFAGPNESFPIVEPIDVHNAAQSLGRAKGDRNAIKRRIVSIAYRKGDDFVAQLPDDWKKKKDLQAASSFARFMEAAKGFFSGDIQDAQDANEMGRNDLLRKLYEALKDVEFNLVNVEDYYPVTDPAHVVYSVYDGNSFTMYERPFELASSGVVTIGAAKVEVQAYTKYEPVEGATPTVLEQNTGEGDPSSKATETPIKGAVDMSKEAIAKFLENASDCQVKALTAFVEGGAQAPAVVAQPTEAELKAAADARAKELRDAVDAGIKSDREQREADAKKNDTIKSLMAVENQPFKIEDLQAKSQAELDTLATFAAKVVPAKAEEKGTRAAVDFGGQGAPRQDAPKEAPKAPSLSDSIRAARSAKK